MTPELPIVIGLALASLLIAYARYRFRAYSAEARRIARTETPHGR